MAAFGWEASQSNSVALHKATSYELRARHPEVPSQLVISARMKAAEALTSAFALRRTGKRVGAPHTERGSIRYDARTYRLEAERGIVGLATVAGRLTLAYHVPAHAKRWMERASGFDSADLVRRHSGWWLHVVVTIEPPVIASTGVVAGVDLGLTRPAVTSEARFLDQRHGKAIEQRHFRLKRRLQSKGTTSAKRHLKALRHRQARFRKDCDHVLTKRIVESVESGSVIVLEDRTQIRSRTKQRGARQRRRHRGWSYAQLRTFVTDKAEERGCAVAVVDPAHTSQRCGRCGHTERANRTRPAVFPCRCCGDEVQADLNAVRGTGAAELAEDGSLRVEISINHGDEILLKAHRWWFFSNQLGAIMQRGGSVGGRMVRRHDSRRVCRSSPGHGIKTLHLRPPRHGVETMHHCQL